MPRHRVITSPIAREHRNGDWQMFWIYWNTAWSLIISGIWVATIVSHPDAELVEIHSNRR